MSLKTARHIYGVSTLGELRAKHLAFLQANARVTGDPVIDPFDAGTVAAHVNTGRWIAECTCGSGLGVEPTWPEARCFECGAVYHVIVPPEEERLDLEHVLRARPPKHQHWTPTETLLDLVKENLAHGVRF